MSAHLRNHSSLQGLCRLCGDTKMQDLGRLPDMYRFAGVQLDSPLDGGRLQSCKTCRSMQRSPVLPVDRYHSLYADGTDSVWSAQAQRPDQDRVRAFLTSRANLGSILDVGCNTGSFLASLPDSLRKCGVEPSRQAAEVARKAGIEIVGADLSMLKGEARFDCITLIDVVEHMPDIGKLLDEAVLRMSDTGCIIISTGSPECPEWQNKFRNTFWYASFAEHITFPSHFWFIEAAARRGLRVEYHAEFRYGRYGPLKTLAKWLLQQSYFRFPPIHYALSWLFFRERGNPFSSRNLFLPCAGLYRDHQIICLSRVQEQLE